MRRSSAMSKFGNAAAAPNSKGLMPTQKGRKRLVALIENNGPQLTYQELKEIYKKQYLNSLDDYEIRHLFGLKKNEEFDEFKLFQERLDGYVDVFLANGDIVFVLVDAEDDDFEDFVDMKAVNTSRCNQQNTVGMSDPEMFRHSVANVQRSAGSYNSNPSSFAVPTAPQSRFSPAVATTHPPGRKFPPHYSVSGHYSANRYGTKLPSSPVHAVPQINFSAGTVAADSNVFSSREHEAFRYSGAVGWRSTNGYSNNLLPPPVLDAPQGSFSSAFVTAYPAVFDNNLPICSVSAEATASSCVQGTNIPLLKAKDSNSSNAKNKNDIPNVIFSLLPKDGSAIRAKNVFEMLVLKGYYNDIDTARDAVQMAVMKYPSSFSFQSEPGGLFLRTSGRSPATMATPNQTGKTEFGSSTANEAESGGKSPIAEALDSETGAALKVDSAFVRVKNHVLQNYSGLPDSDFIKINVQNLMIIERGGGFCRMLVDFSVDGIGEDGDKREKLQSKLTSRFARSGTRGDSHELYFPKVGEHCVTCDKDSAQYYRAEVLRYVAGGCDVRLIDFWEEWRVEVDSLQKLPADLAKVPTFGLELFTPLFAVNRGKEGDFWRLFNIVYSKAVIHAASVSAKICRETPDDPLEIYELRIDLINEHFSVFKAFTEKQLIHFT